MKIKTIIVLISAYLAFQIFTSGSTNLVTGLEIGNKAPGIVTSLVNGKAFNSDSLKGKMVLISFWASHDAVSRIENFRKKMLLEQFHDTPFYNSNGFVVVSISLDQFKAPLHNAISRDGLDDFLHIHDLNDDINGIANNFMVGNEFPIFLLDGEGRIIQRSADLSKIESTLDRLGAFNKSRFVARSN